MSNIIPITFLDVSAMTANLLLRHKTLIEKDNSPISDELLKTWPSARSVLAKIKMAAGVDGAPAKISSVWLETLQPGEHQPWAKEDDVEHDRLQLCLIPAFGAITYSGDVATQLGVGWLNYVNHRVLNSAVNFGSNARTHLVVEIQKPIIG